MKFLHKKATITQLLNSLKDLKKSKRKTIIIFLNCLIDIYNLVNFVIKLPFNTSSTYNTGGKNYPLTYDHDINNIVLTNPRVFCSSSLIAYYYRS